MHIKYPTMLVLQVVNMSFNHSLFIQKNDFDFGIPGDVIKDNSSIKGEQFCFHCFPLTLSFFFKNPKIKKKFCQLDFSTIGDRKPDTLHISAWKSFFNYFRCACVLDFMIEYQKGFYRRLMIIMY